MQNFTAGSNLDQRGKLEIVNIVDWNVESFNHFSSRGGCYLHFIKSDFCEFLEIDLTTYSSGSDCNIFPGGR
jgi:hypothetical protein